MSGAVEQILGDDIKKVLSYHRFVRPSKSYHEIAFSLCSIYGLIYSFAYVVSRAEINDAINPTASIGILFNFKCRAFFLA